MILGPFPLRKGPFSLRETGAEKRLALCNERPSAGDSS